MVQRQVAILCVILTVWCMLVPDAMASQSPAVPKPTLKEQVTQIASGSVVEVKLKQKKAPPIRGRLGAINDSGFELQRTVNDKVVTETVAFQDVKYVKQPGKGMSTAAKVAIGLGVGAALFIIIVVIGYGIENKGF